MLQGLTAGEVALHGNSTHEQRARTFAYRFLNRGRHPIRWRSVALQLLGATSFAVGQPTLELLRKNPTFLTAHGSTALDISLLAAGVLLVPPLLALAVAKAASTLSPGLGRPVVSLFVGVSIAVAALPPALRAVGVDGAAWLLALLVTTAGAGFLYASSRSLRQLLTLAGCAPLLFATAFFLAPSNRALILPQHQPQPVDVPRTTQVVIVVFDELPLLTLLDEHGRIDSTRFPNFARLADSTTWYPYATTNSDSTRLSIPALLTGSIPAADAAPTLATHPSNLFTTLGSDYQLQVDEHLTRMCPQSACEYNRPLGRVALVVDTGIVYLHSVLPPSLSRSLLPSISGRWGGYVGNSRRHNTEMTETASSPSNRDDTIRFRRFIEHLEPRQSTLSYLHVLLPHVPWTRLPDGRLYGGSDIARGRWDSDWGDARILDTALQRHYAQTQFADLLLGTLLDRIAAEGMEDALLVITADHGVAFAPNLPVRQLVRGNAAQILGVPLFIRYPRQRTSAIDEHPAQLIDVAPTIADVLGLKLPWHTDGVSLLRSGISSSRAQVTHEGHRFAFKPVYPSLVQTARLRRLRFQSVDGEGGFLLPRDAVHLIGKRVSSIPVRTQAKRSVIRLDDPLAAQAVDLTTEVLPALVEGRISGDAAPPDRLLVALNGTIAGAGAAYREEGALRFSVFTLPQYWSNGFNRVDLYELKRDGTLVSFPAAESPNFTPLTAGSGRIAGFSVSLNATNPRRVAISQSSSVKGNIDTLRTHGSVLEFSGWAADVRSGTLPLGVVFVHHGRTVYWVPPNASRKDVATHFSDHRLTRSGVIGRFRIDHLSDISALRAYAIFDHTAVQLAVPKTAMELHVSDE